MDPFTESLQRVIFFRCCLKLMFISFLQTFHCREKKKMQVGVGGIQKSKEITTSIPMCVFLEEGCKEDKVIIEVV